jgi:hypothetical protein
VRLGEHEAGVEAEGHISSRVESKRWRVVVGIAELDQQLVCEGSSGLEGHRLGGRLYVNSGYGEAVEHVRRGARGGIVQWLGCEHLRFGPS